MTDQLFPIGVQDFRTIREKNCYYVDKTSLILNLLKGGCHYFLSRPRRFGKSLLLDTIRCVFQGEEELFRGLAIHDQWDWSKTNPIVRLSFGGKYNEQDDLDSDIKGQFEIINQFESLDIPYEHLGTSQSRFRYIISTLYQNTNRRVVILIDEYDKPILDTLNNENQARANRDYLRGFYGIIKDCAEHVEFVFVTGVSMFSKVSLFSGLNNLEDISLNPSFATLCGYTEQEIDSVFQSELEGFDRNKIRHWYNGYNWLGNEKVYNPFDILLLLKNRKFKPYWYDTGSPEFLFRTLIEQEVSPMELENRIADESSITTFDLGRYDVNSLLFQTGYLTITGEDAEESDIFYRLGYPNFEVRKSLSQGLLNRITNQSSNVQQTHKLLHLLAENNFEGFKDYLKSFLSAIPYHWHKSGDLNQYEAWYASLLYMCFSSAGVDIRLEEVSSKGRSDMVIFTSGQIFIFEFKMVKDTKTANVAMEIAFTQMHERGYAEKYHERKVPVHLIGLVFGQKESNLLALRSEKVNYTSS